MFTMLLIRPGAAWLMTYCSASRILSCFKYGEFGGYRGMTTPPGKIGCGAYGAEVAGPGAGTPIGAGTGGSAGCGQHSPAIIQDKTTHRIVIGSFKNFDRVQQTRQAVRPGRDRQCRPAQAISMAALRIHMQLRRPPG